MTPLLTGARQPPALRYAGPYPNRHGYQPPAPPTSWSKWSASTATSSGTGERTRAAATASLAGAKVCRSISLGGFGIQDLRHMGMSLRARGMWLQRTDPSRPWQHLHFFWAAAPTYISFGNLMSTRSSKPPHPGPWATTVLDVFGAITELMASRSWRLPCWLTVWYWSATAKPARFMVAFFCAPGFTTLRVLFVSWPWCNTLSYGSAFAILSLVTRGIRSPGVGLLTAYITLRPSSRKCSCARSPLLIGVWPRKIGPPAHQDLHVPGPQGRCYTVD